MHKSYIGILAGFAVFLAYASYLRSIWKEETRPSATSWGIWAFLGVLVLSGYVSGGARDTAWVALANAVGPMLVFAFCLLAGSPSQTQGLERSTNWLCLVIAFFGVGVWHVTRDASFALAAFLLADFAGTLPTLVKSVLRPHEEEGFPWLLFVAGDVLNVLALSPGDPFEVAFYPWYILVTEGTVLFFTCTKLGRRFAGLKGEL